jgi:hypothetical protein
MSQQIKPTQITTGRGVRRNPNVPLPRDLDQSQMPEGIITVDGTIATSGQSNGTVAATNSDQSAASGGTTVLSPDTAVQAESFVPRTPAILSVKSQTVGFQPDGTAKVDLVLVVEDIDGAVEYDIRVAKDAGNL